MSIQYDLYDTPDIRQTGEKQPLHPRVVFKGTISKDEFLDRVHKFTGMSHSMLAGAMLSFQNELRDLLANGWIVEMGDMGYFSVSLQGPPVMDKKEVRAPSIDLKNINFRANSQFKKEVRGEMRLERGSSSTHPKGKNVRDEKKCLAMIMEHLQKYPFLTCATYCRLTGCTKKTGLKELNAFIERGLLMRYGAGKQVVYAKVMEQRNDSDTESRIGEETV